MEDKFVHSPKELNGFRVVQDIDEVLKALKNGEPVMRYEFGTSMSPMIRSGEYCKLVPLDSINDVKEGDAVFCVVDGAPMTHMVKRVSDCSHNGKYFLIGTTYHNPDYDFGWTNEIYAIAHGTGYIETTE